MSFFLSFNLSLINMFPVFLEKYTVLLTVVFIILQRHDPSLQTLQPWL